MLPVKCFNISSITWAINSVIVPYPAPRTKMCLSCPLKRISTHKQPGTEVNVKSKRMVLVVGYVTVTVLLVGDTIEIKDVFSTVPRQLVLTPACSDASGTVFRKYLESPSVRKDASTSQFSLLLKNCICCCNSLAIPDYL